MHRFRFVLYRPLQLLPVLFGISIVSFVLVHAIPGDPVRAIIGAQGHARGDRAGARPIRPRPAGRRAILRLPREPGAGRDGPLDRLQDAVVGLVAERFEATIFLLAYAVVLALCLAVPLAVTATLRRGRLPDHLIRMFSTAGLGFPAFWLGIMLMIVFSVRLGLFPVSGYGEGFLGHLHHLFLPALAIALALSAMLTRNLRASLLAELDADHIAAARAKGLPARWIFVHHVFRNALIPTINLLGVNLGWLIGGTVVVESVFSVPGLGSLMVSSIFARDYMVVQAITLAFACATVLVNFVVDIVTVALDPRIEL